MENFKLIVAIMVSVVVMQLHGSGSPMRYDTYKQKESLSNAMTLLSDDVDGPIQRFINNNNGRTDDCYISANIFMFACEKLRHKVANQSEDKIIEGAQEVLETLKIYEVSYAQVQEISNSYRFKNLKLICKQILPSKK